MFDVLAWDARKNANAHRDACRRRAERLDVSARTRGDLWAIVRAHVMAQANIDIDEIARAVSDS